MNKRKYKKKCNALFKKAKKLGVRLEFSPNDFDCRRLDCLWYGGGIATIVVSEILSVNLIANGEVRAFLYDDSGNILEGVKDKDNYGAFDKMKAYLKTDEQLRKARDSGKLELDYNNWIEYNGLIKRDVSDKNGTIIDLGFILDNILDNNILTAIGEALDSIEEIKSDIQYIADFHYGIKVGDV